MNLGTADYDGLQTQVSYRGSSKWYADVSYTLSKATNTTEPDGNGIGSRAAQTLLDRLSNTINSPGPITVRQPVELIIRQSTAAPSQM